MESPLVHFPDRPEPLLDSPWAAAASDLPVHGAALDRLFGTSDDTHLLEHFAASAEPIVAFDDPLVLLANFVDGLSLPTAEPGALPMPELAAVYDFAPGVDAFTLHDYWTFDSHA
jgi:hypothetical protein